MQHTTKPTRRIGPVKRANFTLEELEECITLGNDRCAMVVYSNVKLSFWLAIQLAIGVNVYRSAYMKALHAGLYGTAIRMLEDNPDLEWCQF